MKRFLKVLLAISLIVGVAHAKKVMLFDLSKHQLMSKSKDKLETYKLGDLTIQTDLQYHQAKIPYHKGKANVMIIKLPSFENVMVLIDLGENAGKFIIEDEFGEKVAVSMYLENSTYVYSAKFIIKNNKLTVYTVPGNKKVVEKSLKDLEKIKKITLNFRWTEVYDIKIISLQ